MGKVVAIIPARGGSKGITLKNLRDLAFRPLIEYTIQAALESETIDKVIVSTDSERIAEVAKMAGADIPFLRPAIHAEDKTPLAAVMRHFLDWCNNEGWDVEALVILEPTSPLRTSANIDEAVKIFKKKKVDTVVSVEQDTSLWWQLDDDEIPKPLQVERLNRQFLKPMFKENGAIFVTRPEVVTKDTTIGKNVALYEMSRAESIDINTWQDFQTATSLLRSVKILFHFRATAELGFGHFYRVLALANRLYANDVVLLCSEFDEGLEKRIATVGFKYYLSTDPLNVIKREQPTILVNDILDTSKSLMKKMGDYAPLIINFEDLGEGNQNADLVFNALYEDLSRNSSHFGGGKYAIMREEFLFLPSYKVKKDIKRITATFGGSDPNNIAFHFMRTIPEKYPNVDFCVIIGPGYSHDKMPLLELVKTHRNTELIDTATDMAIHFSESDVVITSCGRTVFETAACGVPCVVICQNQREMKHRHITPHDGVISLGLFNEEQTIEKLVAVIENLRVNPSKRSTMSEKASAIVDSLGIFRIIGLIEKAARVKGLLRSL
ncbi:MAG: cytidylyltransferase domain-containing protein [Candidatus Thorarchaeota archaeon]